MLKINILDVKNILRKQYHTMTSPIVSIDTLLTRDQFRYDHNEKKLVLDYNNLHHNIFNIRKTNFSNNKLTGYQLLEKIKSYYNANECKSVLLEIWVKCDNPFLKFDNDAFINSIEIDAHIKFDDDIHPDDAFINQGMMDFAFMTKDKQLFDELTQKKNKIDKK